jgi:acyl-CoA reductase-like NAD-dependent aldehyde dehydrogenase
MTGQLQTRELLEFVQQARSVQDKWARRSVAERLGYVRDLRHSLAESAEDLLGLFPGHLSRSRVDSLTAELIPLADACRFLEKTATALLAPQRLPKTGRSFFCRNIDIELRREPLGVVLIIGPANYPLFLPGVQTVQALAAGNAVLWKPGRGGKPVADAFCILARSAGIPEAAVQVLDESPATARDAIRAGIDKVVLTGSVEAGQAILREAADQITPATVELSGHDCVLVHRTADLSRAARAIRFGANLNGGETCIAPRRILVDRAVHERFVRLFLNDRGIPVLPFDSLEEAISHANRGSLALGASVFAAENIAQRIAEQLNAGAVVINDVVVPTADPRFPFGGRKASGFGSTRGAEGLLQMTALKAIAVQGARRLRHLEPLPENAEDLLIGFMRMGHGKHPGARWSGLQQVLKAGLSVVRRERKRNR